MSTKDEILSQPFVFKNIKEDYKKLVQSLKKAFEENNYSVIGLVGCGSSYYLAMGLAFNINRLSKGKIKAKAYTGSEIAFGLTKVRENSILIGLSRSGVSTETLIALKKAKDDRNVTTACITCSPGSRMVEETDYSATIDFVEEKSIVMTQSFTSMAFLGTALFHELFCNDHNEYTAEIVRSTKIIVDNMQNHFSDLCFEDIDHFVFLGYHEYYAAAMEGLIKSSEMALTQVDVFPTLEYRHGPKAKVHKNTLAIILPNYIIEFEEEKMAKEIELLDGKVFIVSPKIETKKWHISYPYCRKDFSDWFIRVIPLQWLGYKKAISNGLNPDSPKNLDRVVQLEE
ncbi:MAG: SIS domain-containing protein [Kosmotoga sp.]|nr:MAG: SIS domain-containing protein [Kosmotoga sp.]